jgi:nucleoside-diphosphate-sugar epimerase
MNTHQIDFIRNDCLKLISKADSLSKLRNSYIYITGAGGFVGNWLLEFISCLNDELNFNINVIATSRNWGYLKENRFHLYNNSNFTFLDLDVLSSFDIPEECQWVIHLAATPDKSHHASDPLNVVNTIVQGTNNLLTAANRLNNLQKVVYLSSGQVYGDQTNEVDFIDEKKFFPSDCTNIFGCYVQAKRMAENICQIYRSQMRLPISVLRPFSFIGPYQILDKPWAINNFVRDALHGDKVHIEGNPNTIRSYMYPSDMAYWILKYMLDSQDGDVLNLGSSCGYKLLDIAKLVIENVDGDISIQTTINSDSLVPSHFIPSTNKAKTKYGLDITVNLEEAIKRTIIWFKL